MQVATINNKMGYVDRDIKIYSIGGDFHIKTDSVDIKLTKKDV